jgi:hypothetical protein
MDIPTLLASGCVCSVFHNIGETNLLWQTIFERDLHSDTPFILSTLSLVSQQMIQKDLDRDRPSSRPYVDYFRERFYITHALPPPAIVNNDDETNSQNEEVFSRERLVLQKRIFDHVVSKYNITDSSPLSTKGFYKTCTFELHGYVRSTNTEQKQRKVKNRQLKRWRKKCNQWQWKLVKWTSVPISTLCMTALFIVLFLQNILPYFNNEYFNVQNNPNLIDYWRLLTFALISVPLIFFGIGLGQQHAKSILMLCMKKQQSLPTIFFCWMITWGYVGVFVTFFLTTLRLMFPLYTLPSETATLPEGIQFLGLRQLLNRNLIILAPLLTAMMLMNVVTPLFQTFVIIVQHYNDRALCIRKFLVSLIHYALSGIACGTLIYVMVTIDNGSKKGGSGSNVGSIFSIVTISVGIIFLALVVGSLTWGLVVFVRRRVPAAKQRNMAIMAIAMFFCAFVAMACSDAYLILMQLRSKYLMAPMIPVPTLLCTVFYLSIAMFRYYVA